MRKLVSDERADAVMPIACDLVCAVKDSDPERISEILLDPATDLVALAVVLAAMVPDDKTLSELVTVTDEPEEAMSRRVVQQAAVWTSQWYRVPASMIFSPDRRREVNAARMVVCWVAAHQGLTYSEIGRQVGRDHSTVMHAIARVTADRDMYAVALKVLADLGVEAAA
jgi:hypothetical protein